MSCRSSFKNEWIAETLHCTIGLLSLIGVYDRQLYVGTVGDVGRLWILIQFVLVKNCWNAYFPQREKKNWVTSERYSEKPDHLLERRCRGRMDRNEGTSWTSFFFETWRRSLDLQHNKCSCFEKQKLWETESNTNRAEKPMLRFSNKYLLKGFFCSGEWWSILVVKKKTHSAELYNRSGNCVIEHELQFSCLSFHFRYRLFWLPKQIQFFVINLWAKVRVVFSDICQDLAAYEQWL